ncbi:hypothetical protein HCN44_004218 [Aphidius gifuensis]|uniref:Uncharacterized protein n=1 Tax=Aphidius gifuensis TaxID=684658 RepID=A0A834XYS6_APHGI|nr:hypothetical protein HCN44_004218 [Aphidius gifuensis]
MKIIFQVTAIILLLSIIACNASSRCRCGDLGEGTNPCEGKKDVKTRKCTVPGHRREKPRHYASPAAIKAAHAAKEAEKAIIRSSPSITTVVKSGRQYRLGGYGGCKSANSPTSSASHIQNIDSIENEEYHRETVNKLKKLPACERVFPNLPKCTKCGDKVGPLASCGHQSHQNSQSFGSANTFLTFNDQGVPKLTEIQFPTSLASNSNSAPTSNCNLNDFDEAIGAPGMSFADQEKWYRGETKPVNEPADPISQHIFFQHVLEQTKRGKKTKAAMSEAKLNFGPIQRPQNVEQNKTKIEAQEAKLYSLDGPIYELITQPPQPSCAETIEEYQEDRQMSERIQHDLLHQGKKIAESSPSHQYSYSNLGYKPVKKNSNTFVIRDSCAPPPSLTIEPAKTNCGCSGTGASSCTGSCGCSGGSSCNGSCGCKGCGTSGTGACGCTGGTNCNGSCGCSGGNNSNEQSIHPLIKDIDSSYESGRVEIDSSSVESAPSYSDESKVYCNKCKNLYY